MATLTVTTKGQVTLRRDVLRHLGIQPGDQVAVDMLPDGRLELRAAEAPGKISDVFDMLKQDGGPCLSIEEINQVIADGWAGMR